MGIPLRELQQLQQLQRQPFQEKNAEKVCEVFENRNHNIVPLQRQNENGIGAPHRGELFLTCTKKIAHVWPQK